MEVGRITQLTTRLDKDMCDHCNTTRQLHSDAAEVRESIRNRMGRLEEDHKRMLRLLQKLESPLLLDDVESEEYSEGWTAAMRSVSREVQKVLANLKEV